MTIDPPAAPSVSPGGYRVATEVFEGPFDLLLHLILSSKVDLWEVRLSTIVDAYLAEIETMESLDLDVATEFLLIAATLVELKARRLLPGEDDGDIDEELARYEERDYLLARLLECKTFRDAARALRDLLVDGARAYGRRAGPEEPFRSLTPDPLEPISPDQIAAAARRALAPREERRVDTDHVAPVRVTVREAVERVVALLPASGTTTFRDLVVGAENRLEVVVRFLAVLELFKQGMVDLSQPDSLADLVVRPLADGESAEIDLGALDDWEGDRREGGDESGSGFEHDGAGRREPVSSR